MTGKLDKIAQDLVQRIKDFPRVAIAYSGGVDSAVVAKAALIALGGGRSIAVTAVSPSVPEREIRMAKDLADQIGIPHELVFTRELQNPRYVANDGQRCFHCKSELYTQLGQLVRKYNHCQVLNGTNFDDLSDYRPGLRAAEESGIVSPLAELELTKPVVRELARFWGLAVWDKPASPCLASRIAYGTQVTTERLKKIELAEAFLHELGFHVVRVRYLPDHRCRIEVGKDELSRLADTMLARTIINRMIELGFRDVIIDPEGFRSGNLNRSLPLVQLGRK